MTLRWPASRNSFHPAWLLLLVPPLVAAVGSWFSVWESFAVETVARLLLAAVVVAPLVWFRAGPVGDRCCRVLKEFRGLLPGCLIAMAIPGLLALPADREMVQEMYPWMGLSFGLGCFLMSASVFGAEFEQRTFAGLLAQPQSRNAIYAEKIGTLAVWLFVATANFLLILLSRSGAGLPADDFFIPVWIAVTAWCGGPLFSLLTRSTLAGLVFSLAVPPILWLIGMLVLQQVQHWHDPETPTPQAWLNTLLRYGLPVYLVTAWLAGWRVFQRLQVRDGGAGSQAMVGMHALSRPLERLLARALPANSALAAMIGKELRLHALARLVTALTLGLWVLWLLARRFATSEEIRGSLDLVNEMTVAAGSLGLLLLLGIGAASIAEERELGTLEWQLTQPASISRQWWTKLTVTFLLALLLAVGLPLVLLAIGFGPTRLRTEWGEPSALGLSALAGLFLLSLGLCVYASSLSRNTMKALAAAVGLATGLALLVFVCGAFFDRQMSEGFQRELPEMPAPGWTPPSRDSLLTLSVAGVSIATLGLVIALLRLAQSNFQMLRVPVRRLTHQWIGLSVGVLAVGGIVGVVVEPLAARISLANRIAQRPAMKQQFVQWLTGEARAGRLWPELYSTFGLSTNVSPQALAETIIDQRGLEKAVEEIHFLSWSRLQPTKAVRFDPALAARYGLSLGTSAPPASPNRAATGLGSPGTGPRRTTNSTPSP